MDRMGFAGRVGLVAVVALIPSFLPSSFPPGAPDQPDSPDRLIPRSSLRAQQPGRSGTEAQARRVDDRIRALEREADELAGQARTLLGDLRRIEIERDLQTERLKEANASVAAALLAVQQATDRIAGLEQQRITQLPDLEAHLVDVYKRGRAGYAQLLFGARSVREFGRAIRAVAALVRIDEQRLATHRGMIETMRRERAALEDTMRELEAGEASARQARAAAERALAARAALIVQIDARRDLNAQLTGALQVAHTRLQQQLTSARDGRPFDPVAVPITPFRGALDWPLAGRVTGPFGRRPGGVDSATASNGIQIAATEGAPVRAVHPGVVSYARAFAGFGTLVVVDHGQNAYTLYGYLGSASVEEGDPVDAGAEVGRAGSAPASPPALYFEVRVDGRSVDPVQWLKPR